MRFPSIKEVASELRLINANVESEDEFGCPVRLQIYNDGDWVIRYGSPDYDQDHHGYWGSSSIPGVVNGTVGRFNSRDIACDLINQAKNQYWEDYSLNRGQRP